MKNNIILASLSFLMISCGSGSPYTAPATTSNGASTTPGGSTTAPPDASAGTNWNNFNFSATVAGGANSDFLSVTIDKVNKTITVSLPLPFDSSLSGVLSGLPIPAIKGATIAFSQTASGTPVLNLTLPLASIAKGVTGMPSSTLPNGNPLPGMPAGSEPSTQINVGSNKLPVYVYVGQMSIGLFINTPFDPTIALHYGIIDNSGNSVGAIYAIPYSSKSVKDGGFFLNVNVPAKYTQLILNNL